MNQIDEMYAKLKNLVQKEEEDVLQKKTPLQTKIQKYVSLKKKSNNNSNTNNNNNDQYQQEVRNIKSNKSNEEQDQRLNEDNIIQKKKQKVSFDYLTKDSDSETEQEKSDHCQIFNSIQMPKTSHHDNEGVDLPRNHPLQREFCGLIIGKPKSGKTELLKALCTSPELYGGRFDYIYFITDSRIAELQQGVDNHNTELNMDWTYKKIETHRNEIIDADGNFIGDQPINMLFIIDDKASQLKKALKEDSRLLKLVLNRRHFFTDKDGHDRGCISLLFTSQKYKTFHCDLRSQISFVIFFKVPSYQYDQIMDEQSLHKKSDSQLKFAINHVLKVRYGFIYMRDTGEIFDKFRKIIKS